jgi:hypothetical protein
MEKLYISPTNTSPEVHFSPQDNIFLIRGISSPEDVRAMYYPVIEWIKAYVNELLDTNTSKYKSGSPLILRTELFYFNSSSAKFLYDIYLEMKRLIPAGISFIVEWVYDEEDIDLKEAGDDIAILVEMNFSYVPKKGNEV